MHAERGHVPPDRGGHPLDQVGVEGGAPGDRGRVDRRAVRGEPGEALLVHERRDAAAGMPSRTTLLLADQLGGALGGGHRDAAVDPGEVAEPVAARLLQRRRAGGGEDVLHRRDVARPPAGRPGRRPGHRSPRRPRSCRCRPSGCRAAPPSPRGSSPPGEARPGRRRAASGPATAVSPGSRWGLSPGSSRVPSLAGTASRKVSRSGRDLGRRSAAAGGSRGRPALSLLSRT